MSHVLCVCVVFARARPLPALRLGDGPDDLTERHLSQVVRTGVFVSVSVSCAPVSCPRVWDGRDELRSGVVH